MKKKIFFSLAVFLLVFSAASIVKASGNVTGWLWGGGTEIDGVIPPEDGTNTNLGWISMNSANQGGPIDYGVTIPDGDGNLTGYAWSENLGWVSFTAADLAGCPSAPCTARRLGDELHGWARIISIPDAGANSGGWEGWISMSGTADDGSPYGVTVEESDGSFCKAGDPTTYVIDGERRCFAWSDELGWIDFSWASMGPVVPPVKTLKVCRNSCNSGVVRDGTTFSMTVASTENLVACHTSTACFDPAPAAANVTNSATWTETDAPDDAISLSIPAPNLRRVMADNAGKSEQVNVSYNPGTGNINVNFTVSVTAISPYCGDGEKNQGSEECDDGVGPLLPKNGPCPAACSASCTLNDCSSTGGSNWREVAP